MKWEDEAIIIKKKDFGENKLILTVFTSQRGLCRGIIRKGYFDSGMIARARWNARLPEQLGTFNIEIIKNCSADLLASHELLKALSSLASLLDACLPVNHPYPTLYEYTQELLLNRFHNSLATYVLFEEELLATLGYGLSLDHCTMTKSTTDLAYISPKTGKAVCKEVGLPYHYRLFPLPRFLAHKHYQNVAPEDIALGLQITGHFLKKHFEWVRKVKFERYD